MGRSIAPVGPETAQVRVTVPLKPLSGVTVTVEVEEPPGLTEAGERAVAERVKDAEVGCEYLATKASTPPPAVVWMVPVLVGKLLGPGGDVGGSVFPVT